MIVTKIQNSSGSFFAQLSPGDFNNKFKEVRDFGLCQICRVRELETGNPIAVTTLTNPEDPKSGIKVNTYQDVTGWFVDHLVQIEDGSQNNQQRYLFYMDSFSQESPPEEFFLDKLNPEFQWHRYLLTGAANVVSTETKEIQVKYLCRTGTSQISIGKQLPYLHDTPGTHIGRILDFQVHLVYRTGNTQNEQVHIGPGFSWVQTPNEAGQTPKRNFSQLIQNPSQEFINCIVDCIEWENQVKGIHQLYQQ